MSDTVQLLESGRSRLGRWAAAALVVGALHAGGAALAFMYWQEAEDTDDPAGSLTVQLAPLPAAAPVDSPDVAHGPEQQQAKLTHEAAKPVVEEVAKDIPLLEPSPAPEPEVALRKPQPEEKEKPTEREEPREAAPQEQTPQQDADIPVTTAPPRVDAQPAPGSGPAQGRSASFAREQQRWANELRNRLQRFKRYPDAASRRGIKGVTVVRFTVDRSGQVVASEVLQSSGSPILDEEALALVRRASPFPVPPDAINDAYLENHVPIWFGMKPKQ
jgi:periplasmic protein TonB